MFYKLTILLAVVPHTAESCESRGVHRAPEGGPCPRSHPSLSPDQTAAATILHRLCRLQALATSADPTHRHPRGDRSAMAVLCAAA